MKRYYRLIICTAIAILTFIFCINLDAAGKNSKKMNSKEIKNTFDNPDFNFPQTVYDNANQELEKALRSGDEARIVKALLEICSAETTISTDSADQCVILIDSISENLNNGWLAMARMLEASLIGEVYQNDKWTYEERELPASEIPAKMSLWDKSMFRTKIQNLIKDALAAAQINEPIRNYSSLLTPKPSADYLLTDFIFYKGISILRAFNDFIQADETIPFRIIEDNQKDSIKTNTESFTDILLQDWRLTLDNNSSAKRWAIYLETYINGDFSIKNAQYLFNLWKDLEGLPLRPLLLRYIGNEYFTSAVRNSPIVTDTIRDFYSDKNIYSLLLNYKSGLYGKDDNVSRLVGNSVENMITSLSQKEVSFRFPEKILPNRETTLSPECKNINSGYLIVARIPDNTDFDTRYIETKAKLSKCRITAAIPFDCPGTIPFKDTVNVTIPGLAPGRYCLAVSEDKTFDKLLKISSRGVDLNLRIFDVSSLGMLNLNIKGKRPEIFILDGYQSTPVTDTPVKLRSTNNRIKFTADEVTDSLGSFKVPEVPANLYSLNIEVKHDGSTLSENIGGINTYTEYQIGRSAEVKILFDRSIARPGDEVKFSAIAYIREEKKFGLATDKKIDFVLINNSGVEVDSLSLNTDNYGRCSGSFKIPKDGMLGIWQVNATLKSEIHNSSFAHIRVEEYKNPTVRVILDNPRKENDSELVLSGRVETYAGLGIPDSTVDLNILTISPRWYGNSVYGTFSTSTTTLSDGTFSLKISLDELKGTRYEDIPYLLCAIVTTPGGDVAEDRTEFALTKHYTIVPDIPESVEIKSNTVSLNVRVLNQTGEPSIKLLRYKFTEETDSTSVVEGEFNSPILQLSGDQLRSGTWRGQFSMEDESGKESVAEVVFTVWRETDIEVPVEKALWVPEKRIIASAESGKVKVRFGSPYKGQNILCIISNCRKELDRRWIVSDGKMTSIEVEAPADTSRIYVNLATVRNFKDESEAVTILPASERRKLNVKVESFRDKLTSNTRESWRFKFLYGDKPALTDIASMAVMTDKALDSLSPFNWVFSPHNSLSFSPAVYLNTENIYFYYANFSRIGKMMKVNSLLSGFPQEWIYDPFVSGYGIMIRGEKVMYKMAAMEDTASPMFAENSAMTLAGGKTDDLSESISEETAITSYDNEGVMNSSDSDIADKSDEYRQAECPVAFFYPMLTSDMEGELTIDFEVPDYNTLWKFQLIGYDRNLDTSSLTLEATSTKPVMVSGSLPRFVRTGDRVVLTARAFNNSDSEMALGGEMTIMDPLTGKIIEKREFKGENTEPGASRMFTLDWKVPYNLNSVIVLTKATGEDHSDGERAVLPVLPSSSPVIESTDFYLRPGEKRFEMKIPDMKEDSSVTLMYYDNPAWYCLTALPAMIQEDGKTLTSLLYNYYGNVIGAGIIGSHGNLRKGLEEIAEAQKKGLTNMLTSNLELNSQLKSVDLGSSPWVNSAASETERMGLLTNLLDSTGNKQVIDKILSDIINLQSEDGGMKWYPGDREPSYWCTGQMLLHLGMLNRFGYLTSDRRIGSLVSGGFAFCRKEILDNWKLMVKNNGDNEKSLRSMLSTMTNFLYITSLFDGSDMVPTEEPAFSRLSKRSIDLLCREWSGLNIYEKATAATLLASRNHRSEAMSILNSLSQMAMTNPRKGMWYDNLDGGLFSPWNKLITTAQVLEAFSFINPEASEIDNLRQRLLLQRQTEDWGNMRDAAELVQAILCSGTDFTTESTGKFSIKAGHKTLLESHDKPSYGEITVSLEPEQVSGKKLKIEREGADIAWGGIVEQYVAPMSEIKASAIPDLSLEKSIFIIRSENGVEKVLTLEEAGLLKIGDKVSILLTVDCGRDLEYVTLTDERGACLEPSEALSGIDVIDGRFMYREIRNSETRFFISYLPKGHYQFKYDCRLTSEGQFTAGIATIQSLYAPQITAHSAALQIKVK